MSPCLLILNAGSSSLKFSVYEKDDALPLCLRGSVSGLAYAPRLKIEDGNGRIERDEVCGAAPMSAQSAAHEVFAALQRGGWSTRIAAVGHRIVHGGRFFREPCRLDAETRAQLRSLVPLAPLHQPHNLDLVDLAAGLLPGIPQIGCFDTAFHADRPSLDRLYALPRRLARDGIVAYGFHGLSYQHVASVLQARDGARAGGRAVVAHLGSGASLCALRSGRSVATTMGFSALDGVVMSSRSGALDPGVILHLLTERRMSVQEVGEMLYEQAGLLGVSEISGDMQVLLQSDDPRAREAVDLFVYRIGRALGSLAAALGGLDTLVFTAGIGENAPQIRERIGRAAHWLGVKIDPVRNERGADDIAAAGAAVQVLVIAADEERAVAQGVLDCLQKNDDENGLGER